MSFKVDKEQFKRTEINDIKNECYVQGVENEYGPPETIDVWGETKNSLYVPFGYAKQRFGASPNKDHDFPRTGYTFNDQQFPFRPGQEPVFDEALKILKKQRAVLLSLRCGFGKTMLAIRLASAIQLKTAILAHRGVLFEQWKKEIERFTTGKVQFVGTNGILDPDADFYIFNTQYVPKIYDKPSRTWKYKKLGAYREIGLLIVDEAHVACAAEMSKALLYFEPRMMMALTATPARKDGLDAILELYFGNQRITRIADSEFTVYRLSTGIKPKFTRNVRGKKDWNSVIKYLVESPERNQIIIDLVRKFSEYNILVLSKRKDHCTELAKALNHHGEYTTVMKGSDKKYDHEARILLSTFSKLGVGFDDPKLNMLILACDVVEVEQFAGRLRDGAGKNRVIIDLVDDDGNCQDHWLQRRKWYISRNGVIKHYYKEFPENKQKPEKSVTEKRIRLAPKRS